MFISFLHVTIYITSKFQESEWLRCSASDKSFEVKTEIILRRKVIYILCTFFLPSIPIKQLSKGWLEWLWRVQVNVLNEELVMRLVYKRGKDMKNFYRYCRVYLFCCTGKVSTLTIHHLLNSQLLTGKYMDFKK